MELSGHSPFIVCEDVDINKVADIAITGKFRNNGQVCISPNRFYIQENRKEEFVSAFMDRAKKLKIGMEWMKVLNWDHYPQLKDWRK